MKTWQNEAGQLFCEVEIDGEIRERKAHVEALSRPLVGRRAAELSSVVPQLFAGERLLRTTGGRYIIAKEQV